jgi:hypothetical protein
MTTFVLSLNPPIRSRAETYFFLSFFTFLFFLSFFWLWLPLPMFLLLIEMVNGRYEIGACPLGRAAGFQAYTNRLVTDSVAGFFLHQGCARPLDQRVVELTRAGEVEDTHGQKPIAPRPRHMGIILQHGRAELVVV